MDIVLIAKLALYVPILLVFALFCTFYLISGYKKGFWQSLLSLGASVATLIASLLMSKLFGWMLSGPLSKAFSGVLPSDSSIPTELLLSFVQTFIQGVLTFVFFGIFFLIALFVSKKLFKKIHFQKMNDEPQDKKGFRFAGMGLRLVDAVIVTLLVLIPLYGPLSLAMPMASGIVNMTSTTPDVAAPAAAFTADVAAQEEDTATRLINTIDQHPTLRLYKEGPAALVVQSLSTVSLGSETIDTKQILLAIEGTITRFIAFSEADGDSEAKAAALEELVSYMRENVIEKSWAYDIVQAVRKEVEKLPEQEEGLSIILALTNTDRASFKSNSVAVLDFIEYALQNGFMDFYHSSDYECLSPEFYEKLGALINHSEQAITLKKEIIISEIDVLFEAENASRNFVESHIPNEPTVKELQVQEAQAFMLIFFEKDYMNKLEALSRYPNIPYQDVQSLMTPELLANYYRTSYVGLFLMEDFSADAEYINVLRTQLATYKSAPLCNHHFSSYQINLSGLGGILSGKTLFPYLQITDCELEDLLNTVSNEFYQRGTLDGAKVKEILEQALVEAKKNPGVQGYIDINDILDGKTDNVFRLPTDDYYPVPEGGDITIIMPDGSSGIVTINPNKAGNDYDMQTSPDGSLSFFQTSP